MKPRRKVAQYTAKSSLRQPVRLIREMGRDLVASRELAWRLLLRDLSAQYRQSFLGFFWAFVPPVVTVMGTIYAGESQLVNVGKTDIPYPIYVLLGITLWQTFAEAFQGPLQAVSEAKTMLAKVYFPREAIVLAKLGEVFFQFGIKLFPIVGGLLWFHVPITWSIVLFPIALIHLIVLGTACGLILAPIAALYQDISRAAFVVMGLWFVVTPAVYPVPQHGLLAGIVRGNPVTPLLVTARELATTGLVSNVSGFWIASAIAGLGLLTAWLVYRLAMPFVVERMSA